MVFIYSTSMYIGVTVGMKTKMQWTAEWKVGVYRDVEGIHILFAWALGL